MDTRAVEHNLIFDTDSQVYAIIDGASTPMLLGKLVGVKHVCLLRGELSLDLAEAAPYLVELENNSEFSNWLIGYSKHKDCCIYIESKENIFSIRKHCRSLLKAKLPSEEIVFFRFYDPRVLATYIRSCSTEEVSIFLGGVISKITIYSNAEVTFLTP